MRVRLRDAKKSDAAYQYDLLPRPQQGCPVEGDPKYVVDARNVGNVARFINHRSEPPQIAMYYYGAIHETL